MPAIKTAFPTCLPAINFNEQRMTASASFISGLSIFGNKNGDPYGIRTRVTAVKGRCLNRLTKGPFVKHNTEYNLKRAGLSTHF